MQHDLSAGYPLLFDMLLIEGAMNQNVTILGGTRGSLDFSGEPVSAHLLVGNLHLVNREIILIPTAHALFKPLHHNPCSG